MTFFRSHRGIPVADSRLRLAIENDGKVTRVLAKWPELEPLPMGKRAKSRSVVVQETYDLLQMTYHKDPRISYSINPMIAHRDEGDRVFAQPVLRIMAQSASGGPLVGFDVPITD